MNRLNAAYSYIEISQGFKEQALAVSVDPAHKFELALNLNDFATAYNLAQEHSNEQRWKQLSELALRNSEFALAQKCITFIFFYYLFWFSVITECYVVIASSKKLL